MSVELLDPDEVGRLSALAVTYARDGAYRRFSRTRRLPAGADFDAAAHDLFGWQVQLRAGLRVASSTPVVEAGAVVVVRIGVGPIAVSAPCLVVDVVDEPDRRGFTYGTLPGHPESGEESFVLERAGGAVDFTVSALSRPATMLARLGGPAGRLVQDAITRRYLTALG